jgi:hypothetical protein
VSNGNGSRDADSRKIAVTPKTGARMKRGRYKTSLVLGSIQ